MGDGSSVALCESSACVNSPQSPEASVIKKEKSSSEEHLVAAANQVMPEKEIRTPKVSEFSTVIKSGKRTLIEMDPDSYHAHDRISLIKRRNGTGDNNGNYGHVIRTYRRSPLELGETQVLIIAKDHLVRKGWSVLVVRAGENDNLRPITISHPIEESETIVLSRLVGNVFQGYKALQKEIARAVSAKSEDPPAYVTKRGAGGEKIKLTIWGILLTESQAKHLPNPKLERSETHGDEEGSAVKSQALWAPFTHLLDAIAADPYEGGQWKATRECLRKRSGTNKGESEKRDNTTSLWESGLTPMIYLRSRDPPEVPEKLIPQIVAAAGRLPGGVYEVKRLQQILNHARSRAYENGAENVCARDIIDAAKQMEWEKSHGYERPTPPSFPPKHYGEQRQALAQLAEVIKEEVERGMPKPWVLVACECTGLVARHFKLAGCEVATCDLKESEDVGIPHFKGDARKVINLGFDLVISHPPCTHLSNASVFWLSHEPERWGSMHSAARFFREMYNAKAPFTVVEQPVIHRYARQQLDGLRPTQMINPWEHGHGERKSTALYIRGDLPTVKPTCVVLGRECRLSNLQSTPERGSNRSRFFIGVGAAMAMAWVPTLIEYCRNRVGSEARPTLSSLCEEFNADTVRKSKSSDLHKNDEDLNEIRRRDSPFATQWVATARQQITTARTPLTSWVLCEHGAVLMQGIEPEEPPAIAEGELYRCQDPECIEDATRWWREQSLAKEYRTRRQKIATEKEEGAILKADLNEDGREFPVRRIRKRGNAWFAWTPSASRFASAGNYSWLRMGQDTQTALDNEMDKLRSLKLSIDGCSSDRKSALLRPQLPTIWSDGSLGFKYQRYTDSHERRSQTQWNELRKIQDDVGNRCGACGAQRKTNGKRTCRCGGECPAIGAATRLKRDDSMKDRKTTNTTMKFIKSKDLLPDQPPIHTAAVCRSTAARRELTCPPIKLIKTEDLKLEPIRAHGVAPYGAIEQRRETVGEGFKRKVGEIVGHAASFGVATTPKGMGESHCAYIADLIVVDRESHHEPRGFQVASWVRYSLADTGAGPSIVASALLEELPKNMIKSFEPMPSHVQGDVAGADGNLLVILGTVMLTFHLGGRLFEHRFQVVEGGQLLILGNDFIGSHHGSVHPRLSKDPEQGYVELEHEPSGKRVRSQLKATPEHVMMPIACVSSANEENPAGVRAQEGGVNRTPSMNTQSGQADHRSRNVATVTGGEDAQCDPEMKLTEQNQQEEHQEVICEADLADLSVQRFATTQGGTDDPREDELVKAHLITREHLLVTSCPISIPAWTERRIRVRLPKPLVGHDGPLLILPLPERKGLHRPNFRVAPSICRGDGDFISVTILNSSKLRSHIGTLAALATVEAEVQVVVKEGAQEDNRKWKDLTLAQLEVLNKCEIDTDKVLSESQLERTRDLLAKYLHVFAPNPKCPGRTHFMEVNLNLKPGMKPHRHAPSRLGEVGGKIVQEVVDELEANGVVRRSNSPWASRLVIVKKKDGTPRVCIDLRDCNSKLEIEDTPLPRCDEAISKLAGTPNFGGEQPPPRAFRLYHTVDLASGFHCLPVKEEHKERLAFVTQRGKWEFNVLPFGLASGPSIMQTLIDAALQGLAWEICVPYLDDVCVFAAAGTFDETFELALERLDLVLQRLGWAGLTAKAQKCSFFQRKVDYLGHVISQTGVSPDPKKVEGISKIKPETICTLETIRSFLGMSGYYRSFIKDYQLMSGPLVKLTRKGVDVRVEAKKPEVREAVIKIKEALMTAPVLAPPRNDRPFIIHTDAATGHGIGGILLQRDDSEDGKHNAGAERPIGYYGRRCNDAERNYSVTEVELLAVVETIKHFRPYLWGRHFTLVTDHAALKWLATMKESVAGGASSRLTRWSLRLQEYRFDVIHKPGVAHKDADGISRLVGCIVPMERGIRGTSEEAVAHFREQIKGDKLVNALTTMNRSNVEGNTRDEESLFGRAVTTTYNLSRIVVQGPESVGAAVVAALPTDMHKNALLAHEAVAHAHLDSEIPRAETLRKEQLLDTDSAGIMTYIVGGVNLETQTKENWLKGVAPHCHVENGLLMHAAKINGVIMNRIWIPKTCRESVLSAFHEKMGHMAKDRTYGLMQRTVYWPGMSTDVTRHVEECHECSYVKRRPRKAGATQTPEVGQYPFELMITDILSMRKSIDGYTKVLIFADSLTRWIEAIPFKHDPSSSEVVSVFMTHVVCKHGVPRCIRSDCGSNLTSKLCKEVFKLCGVDLAQSTAYHHATAGIVERFNSTLVEMTKASNPKGKDWASHLPFLCFAYNATPHRVTKESPACLIYGRDLRLPANMDLHSAAPSREQGPLTDYARRLYEQLRLAWDLALKSTYTAQRSDAERIDVTRDLSTSYKVNERVLMKMGSSSTQNKLEYKWLGPFRIAEILERGCYRLRDLHSKRTIDRVATDRLRPYLTITDIEPLAPDEYIVKEIIGHRRLGDGKRQYKVHYRGYQKKEAEWNNEDNLLVRCADLVIQYNKGLGEGAWRDAGPAHKPPTDRQPQVGTIDKEKDKALKEKHKEQPLSPVKLIPKDLYPRGAEEARFEKGLWIYNVKLNTKRGWKPRWLPTTHFTTKELEQLKPLRTKYCVSRPELAKIVAVCEEREGNMCLP